MTLFYLCWGVIILNDTELCNIAKEVMKKAYSPYSNCNVGAALLCENGKVYTGFNIENASFTPTVCAERVAFFNAISAGERSFKKIAVVGGKNNIVDGIFAPCGVCRQVMREFCSDDFEILLCHKDGYEKVTLKELLPYSFSPEDVI